MGRVEGRGTREIDATDLMVTPGFVDLHTHLDAQIGWDRRLESGQPQPGIPPWSGGDRP